MKAYTDIEQSKKLAEILPLESADSVIVSIGDREGVKTITIPKETFNILRTPFTDIRNTIHCWSLAALLNILAKQDFIIKSDERNDGYRYNIDIPSRHCKIWFSSLLDAAFEMVCWLKKNGK